MGTTLVETFNKADSTTLGPDQTWTEVYGDLQIVNNKVRCVNTAANFQLARLTTPAGGNAHRSTKITIGTLGSSNTYDGFGAYVAGNSTQWIGVMFYYNAGQWYIATGTVTLATGATSAGDAQAIALSVGDVIEVRIETLGANPTLSFYKNGTFIKTAGTSGTFDTAVSGIGIGNQTSVGICEISHFESGDQYLPVILSGYTFPMDGIGWTGPFISSNGYVCTFGLRISGIYLYPTAWRSSDPSGSFTYDDGAGVGIGYTGTTPSGYRDIATCQSGDIVYILVGVTQTSSGALQVTHLLWSYNMSTGAWVSGGGSPIGFPAGNSTTPINYGAAIAKRSTNNDLIVFYNAGGITNMGKTYGRVAARRSPGPNNNTFGAETAIGIAIAGTTQQSESVEAAMLASSDRVHLFWSKSVASAPGYGSILTRCVKSTDNLDGTSPATAAQTIATQTAYGVGIDGSIRAAGQPFLSSGNTIAIPYYNGSTGRPYMLTASDADSPTYSEAQFAANASYGAAAGLTTMEHRFGGAPWDGTNKTAVWIDSTSQDPYYDKDTGSGWGTDVAIDATTATQISGNVYQRGNYVVLAVVYDRAGTWVYNEVVLRTAGLSATLTPVTITLTPQALAKSVGDAPYTLTPAIFTLAAQALAKSVGDVNRSLTNVSMTLTAQALSRGSDTVARSLTNAALTLTPQAFATAVGDTARSLTNAALTLAPQPLTEAEGGVTCSISPAIFTLTAQAITGEISILDQATSISPILMTLQPQALAKSVGDVTTSVSHAAMTLTPQELTRTLGELTRSISPAIFTLTPQAVARSIGDAPASVSPALMSLTPQALATSVGGTATVSISPVVMSLTALILATQEAVAVSINPATISLTGIALATSVGGTATTGISPALLTLSAQGLARGSDTVSTTLTNAAMSLTTIGVTASKGDVATTLTPVAISLVGVSLATSVGGSPATSISPAALTLTPQAITGFATEPGVTNIAPVIFSLTPQALTESVGGVTSSISPATVTLVPQALARSIGDVSRSLTFVPLTLTPQSLGRSVGGVTASLTPVTLTLTSVALTKMVGDVTTQIGVVTLTLTARGISISLGDAISMIDPVNLTMTIVMLTISGVGGRFKVWDGNDWVERPLWVWTGSEWIEKPLKVFTADGWKLA